MDRFAIGMPDACPRVGAAPQAEVTRGEGQFARASGLITSNFFVGEDLAVTDHHFGVIFVR